MALKVKNFNINGADGAVTSVIKINNTRKKNQEQLHADFEDIYSKKGKQSGINSCFEISNKDKLYLWSILYCTCR